MRKTVLSAARYLMRCVSGLLFLMSCVNEEYDLSEGVQADGTFMENISVPIGSVQKITLDKILFENGETLNSAISYASNGDLHIEFFGQQEEFSYTVPSWNFNDIIFEDQLIKFPIPSYIAGQPVPPVDFTLRYSDVTGKPLSFGMQYDVDSPLPDEIIDATEISLDATLTCRFTLSAGTLYVAEGFELVFPKYVSLLKPAESADYEIIDRCKLKLAKDLMISQSNPLEIKLMIDKIALDEDTIIQTQDGTSRIMINDELGVNGDFYLNSKDYDAIPENIEIGMKIIAEDIVIEKVSAHIAVDVSIDDRDIHIAETPDLLKGKGICIDLYNPVMNVEIENPTPFNISFSTDLNAYSSSNTYDISLGKGDDKISIPADGTGVYWFSRRKVDDLPAGAVNFILPEIGDFIHDVPERFTISNAEVTFSGLAMIELDKSYTSTVTYGMSSPLSFGEDLYLSFDQELKDLNLSFGVKIMSAVLEMDIINTIPVDFEISAICLDSSGNELNDTQVTVDNKIVAGSLTSPTTTPVKLTINNKSGKIDITSIKLNMRGSVSDPKFFGVCLNRNQGLEINDIVLTLPDGIGFGLNNE